MPLRGLQPLTFRARGLTDAIDATNAFPGAMGSLANLVPAPGNVGIFVPRPAGLQLIDFALHFASPTFISLQVNIGTRIYGLVSTARFPGFDEPFIYDLTSATFIPVAGVNANNVPQSPLTTGDWHPPTLAAPTNSRFVVSHPGFTGAGPFAPYFGWFDMSNLNITSLSGTTTVGSNVITSINDGFTSAPIIDGVQPGQILTSVAGFPGPVTVISVANGSFDLSTTCDTDGTTTIKNIQLTSGILPGMGVFGPLFAPTTTVVSINAAAQTAVLSLATLGSGTATSVNFSGGGTITVSSPATSSVTQTALTIKGGTYGAPLWGAGNANTFPISKIPKAVGSYNGRAAYAVANGVVFSDSLNPTQVTNASQALILGDNTDVTALAGLPFINTVTGGAVTALIVFKGPQPFYQITGDYATNNLEQNLVEGSVGTNAPATIVSVPEGLAFVAIDGLRILQLNGQVSEPIGAFGEGVNNPLVQALYPSRMCAAYGQNTIRFSLQRGDVIGVPWQEFCYDMRLKAWHGPHSFPALAISSVNLPGQVGFVIYPQGGQGAKLWFHSLVPTPLSGYIEGGEPIQCTWTTALLPDNQRMVMNSMVETALGLVLPAQNVATVTFADESGAILNEVGVINPNPYAAPIWGQSTWGGFTWGALPSYFRQYTVPWTDLIVFKQGTVSISVQAAQGIAIGNLYLGYQILGYMMEDLPTLVGYTGITGEQLMDGSFTAIAGVALPDGSFTAILATLIEQSSGYP